MTSMARPTRDIVSSTRAPYAPVVMLIGAVLVIGVVIRLLNSGAEVAAPTAPLSGQPIGNGEAPVVVTQPAVHAPSGSLSLLMPMGSADEPLPVGPAAFPAGASLVLSVVLPTDAATSVVIGLSRMAADGTLQAAQPVSLEVTPDENGAARVSTSVAKLTAELGPGLYRLNLRWDDQSLATTDVALGLGQPNNVAIFDAPRQVTFAAGTYTGVRMDPSGVVTDEKPYRLDSASGAPSIAFGVVNGRPHLLISQGVWGGYWVAITDGVSLD